MVEPMTMKTALRIARLASLALAAIGVVASVDAGVLYKSVDRSGRVTFSDMPVEGAVAVQRIETSDSVKPAVSETPGAPMYLALADSYDEAVAQANAKVDLAEHALAVARASIVDEDPLSLGGHALSRADRQQLEFYKKDLASARRQLMRVLQQRNILTQRPLA